MSEIIDLFFFLELIKHMQPEKKVPLLYRSYFKRSMDDIADTKPKNKRFTNGLQSSDQLYDSFIFTRNMICDDVGKNLATGTKRDRPDDLLLTTAKCDQIHH